MTMQRSIALCVAVLLVCGSMQAQRALGSPEEEKTAPVVVQTPPPADPGVASPIMRLGVSGAYNLGLHSADAMTLPTIPSCCSGYTSTTGGGVALGAEVAFVISPRIDILARLTYQTASATMTTDEPTTIRDVNGTRETALRHTLTSSLGMLFLEPGVEMRVGSALGVMAGARVGMLMSATYTERETFADPSIPYDYSDGSSVNNPSEGDLPEKNSMQFGLFVGARYHLALNSAKTFHLVPSVEFAPLFSEIVKETAWSVSSFRVGLGLTITLMRFETLGSPLRP